MMAWRRLVARAGQEAGVRADADVVVDGKAVGGVGIEALIAVLQSHMDQVVSLFALPT